MSRYNESLISEVFSLMSKRQTYIYLAVILGIIGLQAAIVYFAFRADALTNLLLGRSCFNPPGNIKILVAIFGMLFFSMGAVFGVGEMVNAMDKSSSSRSENQKAGHRRNAIVGLSLAATIAIALGWFVASWC